jgi:DNA-binding NtrC family response regulator
VSVDVLLWCTLQGSCAELIVVDDGQQAVDAYRASRPDLMLLDVHMPNVSGLSLAVVPVMLVNPRKNHLQLETSLATPS